MTIGKYWTALAALGLAGSLAACGSSEPSPEELDASRAEAQANQQDRRSSEIADFANIVAPMVERLKGLNEGDVSDMEGAADVWGLFDQAARNVQILEESIAGGQLAVSPAAITAKDQLKTILISKQRQLFPAMRRTYAAYMSSAVSGLQANFRAVGGGGKTLRGASPVFSSQATVMDAHYSLASQATRFRFTQAEYVYSLTGASYTMTVHGKADDDIGG